VVVVEVVVPLREHHRPVVQAEAAMGRLVQPHQEQPTPVVAVVE